MNANLLNALKQIVSRHGGVEAPADGRRVKALLAGLVAGEPGPQKNALVACLGQGFAAMLQNVPANERGAAKARLSERLNREEGLGLALCADTLDLLEAALFETGEGGGEAVRTGGKFCPACGAGLPGETRFCLFCGTAVAEEAAVPTSRRGEIWRKLQTLKGIPAGYVPWRTARTGGGLSPGQAIKPSGYGARSEGGSGVRHRICVNPRNLFLLWGVYKVPAGRLN
jgi:hypothetical protein